jgi:hypothetical protein
VRQPLNGKFISGEIRYRRKAPQAGEQERKTKYRDRNVGIDPGKIDDRAPGTGLITV